MGQVMYNPPTFQPQIVVLPTDNIQASVKDREPPWIREGNPQHASEKSVQHTAVRNQDERLAFMPVEQLQHALDRSIVPLLPRLAARGRVFPVIDPTMDLRVQMSHFISGQTLYDAEVNLT